MLSFNQLKRNLKKDFNTFKKIRVSILAEDSSQLLVQAIKGYGFELGYNIEINECGYNEVNLQVFEPNSQLHSFPSDFVVIVPSTQKLLKKFYSRSHAERITFADGHLLYIESLTQTLDERSDAKIIFCNFLEINDGVFGNYSSKVEASFLFQLRKINFELMRLAQKTPNVFINDLLSLQIQFGTPFIIDNKFYVNSDITFSIDFLPHVAKNLLDVVKSVDGKIKKCLILDLDNTLWGGVIGDDGVEGIQIGDLGVGKAFTELQLWAKQLKERGIILAVCSKNTDDIAKEPFNIHPDMILKLDDIAVFVANWENKVDNIKHIQSVLNIGFDSMVFVDDNPFERNLVAENIEGITVPDMPEDPADYLSFLRSLNLFETASFTEGDSVRTNQYQDEAKRIVYRKHFANEGEYLSGLTMVAKIEGFNKFNIPRISQLTQRSNQFNLRAKRYTEKEIEKFSNSEKHVCLLFALNDKFGDHGLIAVVIGELKSSNELFIDTWLMSCRVLKRGMEGFVLNRIVGRAKQLCCKKVIGEYIPTSKNNIVANHYKDLGFEKAGEYWELDVESFEEHKMYIDKE
ncbi:MAG: HAD-IIIC family phosphatase [Burkholderiales bacterium]|nr:HAD-IIIC family phosphatase [Bacteroidia bacterium]